jgi:hypothetical protein
MSLPVGSESLEWNGFFEVLNRDTENVFSQGWRFSGSETFLRFKTLQLETQRAVLIHVFSLRAEQRALRNGLGSSFRLHQLLGYCLGHFGRTDFDLGSAEAHKLFRTTSALPFDGNDTLDEYRFAVGLAEHHHKRGPLDLETLHVVRTIFDQVSIAANSEMMSSTNGILSLKNRLANLLPASNVEGLDRNLFAQDAFGSSAYVAANRYSAEADLGNALVHLSRPTTSAGWKNETIRWSLTSCLLLDLARDLLEILAEDPKANNLPSPTSVALIKGAACTVGFVGRGADALLLERVVHTTAGGIWSMITAPRMCVEALGNLNDPEGLAALTRLQGSFRSGAVRKRIDAALDEIAVRLGYSRGQIVERQVGTYELDLQHEKVIRNSKLSAVIAASVTGITTAWYVEGNLVKSVPADYKRDETEVITSVRAAVKELSAAFSIQRFRLECLFAENRVWTPTDWLANYQGHRLVGALSEALLWQAEVDRSWKTFLGNQPIPANAERIRLWHPLLVEESETELWRDEIARRELRQPFKQAYRERYVITPAEAEAELSSARFARHILRIDQLYALMKVRGWQAKWMGTFDGGYAVTPSLVLNEGNHRVGFDLQLLAEPPQEDCAISGGVHFSRRVGKSWRPTPMADVPPLVFSEALRDVDLFVSVCTVANDPLWRQRRLQSWDEQRRIAWEGEANGELTAIGQSRRAVIERILPKLKFASQCTLEERALLVKGAFAEYAINLGTANVMMLPANQYLCIVQGSASAARNIFLPFEGDSILSLILSKAALLAVDRKITDESILRQIRSA